MVSCLEPLSRIGIVAGNSKTPISLLLAFRNTNNVFIPIVYATEDELNKKIIESSVDVIFQQNDLTFEFNYKFIQNEIYQSIEKAGLILFSSGWYL